MNGIPLWAFMVLLGALGALLSIGIAMIVRHFRDDQLRAERLAVVEHDVQGIKSELGDHDSGLRGWLHRIASDISPYILKRQHEDKGK